MNVFLAKQAIYNVEKNIVGYELLHRNSYKNKYDLKIEQSKATIEMIRNFKLIGNEKLTSGKRAFINFPENSIINKEYSVLNKNSVVIEILEDVNPDKEVLLEIKNIKEQGYTTALDDVSNEILYEKFLDLIDIYKVDFIKTSKEERNGILKKIKKINGKAKFLAEKVENTEQYKEAIECGYDYFQGYYFNKPEIINEKLGVCGNNK